jgi:hypothetical protein
MVSIAGSTKADLLFFSISLKGIKLEETLPKCPEDIV